MSEKYPLSMPPGNTLPWLITNDLYLAAFLLCAGERLCRLEHNGRRRISFVFAGERVKLLREEYESGTVRLNMRSFRDSLSFIRRRMDGENDQRSAAREYTTNARSESAALQPVPGK